MANTYILNTSDPNQMFALATQVANGLMSAADKKKLDQLADDSAYGTIQTIDNSWTTVASYTVPDIKTTTFHYMVSARKLDGSQGATFQVYGGFRRTGSTVTQIGSTQVLFCRDDSDWSVELQVVAQLINLRVLGKTSTTIVWAATGRIGITPLPV